jgi:hypothetical protein
MSDDEQLSETRLTGDAAWIAHRGELERRNAAAKRKAAEHPSAMETAAAAREHRLARAEEQQLQALNRRIARGSRS